MSQEHAWAAELNKKRTKKRSAQGIPATRRHADTTNKTEYYKILLQQSIDAGDMEGATKHFETLVGLRIALMHQNLERIEQRFGMIPETDRAKEIEHLQRDCARLAASADYLFDARTNTV